jgi:predicted ATP-grasp superfamily ATP-dependent carboligase
MRALVLDQGLDRGSLAAVRALHDDGWSVGVGSPFRGLSGTSRFAERWHRVPAAEGGVGDYLDAVAGAVAEGSYRVVFSADDIGVLALSRHRHEVGAVVPYADHATVVRSIDKLEMTRAAERAGLAVPHTVEATDEAVAAVAEPTIVKPRLHSVLQPGAPGRLDTTISTTPAEAREAVATIRAAGVEAILQEVVDGELASFQAVIDSEGRMLAPVQQRSPRSWPPGSGSAARSHTVGVDPSLSARVLDLFHDLGWFGLAQLQFIAPHGGGEPRLIDLNGRFYSSLALAVASGANLPAIWARLATGLPLRPWRPSRLGCSYQWFSRDLRDSWRHDRTRGILVALGVGATSVHGAWSRHDPLPALNLYGTQLVTAGSRRARRLARMRSRVLGRDP